MNYQTLQAGDLFIGFDIDNTEIECIYRVISCSDSKLNIMKLNHSKDTFNSNTKVYKISRGSTIKIKIFRTFEEKNYLFQNYPHFLI